MTAPQLPFPRPDVLSIGPLYAQLRATAPLCAVRTPAGDPAWLVTSHALARELLADPRLGRSHPDPERASRISGSAVLGGPMGDAATEAQSHAEMRKLLAPAFAARRMHRLRAHVADLVAEALDRMAAHGAPADLHELVSLPIPVLVICELLGVPYADRDRFRALSEGAGGLTDRDASLRALHDLVAYIGELLPRKRSHLAFGYGPRYCIGAALARVELQAVFAALPARFPDLELAVPAERLELRADLLTGGLRALPVRW